MTRGSSNFENVSLVTSGYGCRQPSIVDVQILRVGQLVILAVPGELTTMSGRRLREAIYDQVGFRAE